jgi:hypothetical protein
MRFSFEFESGESFSGRGTLCLSTLLGFEGTRGDGAAVDSGSGPSSHWICFADTLASALEESVGEG